MSSPSWKECCTSRQSEIARLPGRVLASLIRLYQIVVSPLLGPHCRFSPSCSSYAREAFLRFGVWRGLLLSGARLGRCHPWNSGGYDPVPGAERARNEVEVVAAGERDRPDESGAREQGGLGSGLAGGRI